METENLAPKKRGRPPGAKNKAKPTPKPAPKAESKAKKKVIQYDDKDYEEEELHPLNARMEQPMLQLDRQALAAEVLGILQQHRYNRTSARRNHYANWFANMY